MKHLNVTCWFQQVCAGGRGDREVVCGGGKIASPVSVVCVLSCGSTGKYYQDDVCVVGCEDAVHTVALKDELEPDGHSNGRWLGCLPALVLRHGRCSSCVVSSQHRRGQTGPGHLQADTVAISDLRRRPSDCDTRHLGGALVVLGDLLALLGALGFICDWAKASRGKTVQWIGAQVHRGEERCSERHVHASAT